MSNGHTAKASREVKVGDALVVKNDVGEFHVAVLALIEMRGPAAQAATMYAETEASRAARARLVEERKNAPGFDAPWEGRPSKRDRRIIDRFRGR